MGDDNIHFFSCQDAWPVLATTRNKRGECNQEDTEEEVNVTPGDALRLSAFPRRAVSGGARARSGLPVGFYDLADDERVQHLEHQPNPTLHLGGIHGLPAHLDARQPELADQPDQLGQASHD